MSKPAVRFVVDLAINEGKFADFERIAKEMTAASRKESGTLGYDWHLSGDRKRCRLVEHYPDGDAVVAHMNGPAVKEGVPKLLTVSSVKGFEVYGDPGSKATEVLNGFGAEIFPLWQGLSG